MTAPAHLMTLIDDEFARAIGRDLVRQAIRFNTLGNTPLNNDAQSAYWIAEEARPANIFGLIWRINALDDAIRDEMTERDAAAQLCSIVIRDACELADAEYRRLLAGSAKTEAMEGVILDRQDPMAVAAREYLEARALYAAATDEDAADDGPVARRFDAATDAVIAGPPTASLTGALLAAEVIASNDAFICSISEGAFQSLHAWLRSAAATSTFEQGKRDQVEELKQKAKGRPGRKGRAAA